MNKKIRFAFLGATQFSKDILSFLIDKNFIPKAVFTIPEFFNISYSKKEVKNCNFSSLKELCALFNIPIHQVNSGEMKLSDYEDLIKSLELDVIFVMGWYYMIPESIRNVARLGAWGIHASLLPDYAGGAPLVWAIINGETKTGVTLFKLSDGVDDGDIIAQQEFEIDNNDSIKEVYAKATIASKKILETTLNNFPNIKFTPQKKDQIRVYPQRKPDDGEINMEMNADQLYNFIRAQSSPYPGAFIRTVDGKKLVIEKARIE